MLAIAVVVNSSDEGGGASVNKSVVRVGDPKLNMLEEQKKFRFAPDRSTVTKRTMDVCKLKFRSFRPVSLPVSKRTLNTPTDKLNKQEVGGTKAAGESPLSNK